MQKKLLSILLVLCMLLSMFPITLPVSAADTTTEESTGTSATATEISTAEALLKLMNDPTAWAGSYKLIADINLGDYTGTEYTQQPIGNSTTAFTGSFDGNGKTISGINISGTTQCVGLFGIVSSDGDTTVIKNLTIKGSVSTTSNFAGCLVGVICGDTSIEGVTVGDANGSMTFTDNGTGNGRLGGIVGGIIHNNALDAIKTVEISGTYDVTIKNCTNYVDLTGNSKAERLGGIVGTISSSTADFGAIDIAIINCVNNGDVTISTTGKGSGGIVGYWESGNKAGCTNAITYCKNYGTIKNTTSSGNSYAGGIVGYSILQNSTLTDTGLVISYCYNEGEIICWSRSGGILGYAMTSSAYSGSELTKINNCWNDGKITCNKSGSATVFCSGIAGVSRCIITNCWNTGSFDDASSNAGINACIAGSNTFKYNYSAGSRAFGATSTSVTAEANYYSGYTGTNTDPISTAVTDVTTADSFEGLNAENAWVFGPNGPELAYFHTEHVSNVYVAVDKGHSLGCYCGYVIDGAEVLDHNVVDGKCSDCGAISCAHTTTDKDVTKTATCKEDGLYNLVCSICGTTTQENVSYSAPYNHTGDSICIVYDEDYGIRYNYECCGAYFGYDDNCGADIYVSSTGTSVTAATDAYSVYGLGLAADNAFADFELAMEYAAASLGYNKAVTIHIVDKAEITSGYYKTPEYDGTITITTYDSDTTDETVPNNGELWFMTYKRRWYANGDVTFKNLTFRTNAAELSEDHGVKIFAQNHKMVFGEGIVMGNVDAEGTATTLTSATGFPNVNDVKMYVYGGFENEDCQGKTMATDITIRSGDYWAVYGWNDAVKTISNSGTGKLTVGKTTDNADDYLFINYLIGFSADKQSLSEASKVTMIIDGILDTRSFYPGTQNELDADSDILYETDLVLKGDLNTVATDTMGALDVIIPKTTTNTKINMYVDKRETTAIADQYRFYGTDPDGAVTTDTTVAERETAVTVDTYVTYCNTYLTHTGMGDGVCDECGYSTACNHTNTSPQYVTVPTCKVDGIVNWVCDDCSTTVTENDNIGTDASNHDLTGAKWAYDSELASYVLKCPDCQTNVATTTDTPVAYVDNGTKISTSYGVDSASGLAADSAVRTIEEGVTRLAATGGNLIICDRYTIEADVNLPKYEKLITISYGEESTGFNISANNLTINLNGPTKFEKFVFNGGSNTVTICANWNDLEFGSNITNWGSAYIVMGSYYNSDNQLTSATNDTQKTVTLKLANVKRGSTTTDNFYSNVILGDRLRSGATTDTITSYTVSNKTINAEINSATVGVLYTGTTGFVVKDGDTVTATIGQMDNYKVAVDLNGTTTVSEVKCGTDNTIYGSAYLDNLTLNFNDSSVVTDVFKTYNVKDITIKISTVAEGRTEGTMCTANLYLTKSSAYTPTGSETASITYGTHSIANGKVVQQNAMYGTPAFVPATTDECEGNWGDGVITTEPTLDADGEKTYTCSVCGRTKTEDVPFECTEHTIVVTANNTYYCSNCKETLDAPTAGVVIAAVPTTTTAKTVDVNVEFTTNTPFNSANFTVSAPTGFTLTGVTSTLDSETDAEAEEAGTTGFIFSGATDLTTYPYEMAVVNNAKDDANNLLDGELDQVVVTLTFTLADTVEDGTYVIEVASLEVANASLGAVDNAAVSAEVIVDIVANACTHANTTTSTTNATCTTDGSTTVTCNDCGATVSTSVIPATDHDMQLTSAKEEATCTEDGKEALYTCANGCGKTEGGAVIPATDHDMQLTSEKEEATCTEDGKEALYTCANGCGKTEGGAVIPATDHDMQLTSAKEEATCTEDGKEALYTCANGCGTTEGGAVIPATGEHNHVKGDLVPATRTTEAYYTYTCSCGDSYTQDVKGEYETDVEFKHSVDLESEYIFNFKVTKTTVSDTYDDQWFEITKYPYVNGVATPTTHIVEASDRDAQWEGRAPAIAAKEMNDKMEAVFCQIVDGVKYTSQVDICNLVGYYQLASGANAPVAAVIAEMMNYGAAAQIMFSYNTTTVEGDDNTGLINRHIDTSKHTIKSSLEDYSDVILSATRVKYGDTEGKAYTVKSNSALLESKINLVMKYNIIPEYADDLDVDTLVYRGTYTTVTGEPMTIEVSGDKFDDSSSTILNVDLDQIAVKDLRQPINGAIYDANGNKVSETCETSFECYAKAANDAVTEEINKHLAKAVISFCNAAKDYFG